MLLGDLEDGQYAVVTGVSGEGVVRRHLLDMGLTPHAQVMLQKRAPMGDPIQITVRGFELTLRLEEAQNVEVNPVKAADATRADDAHAPASASAHDIEHPGLGELSGTTRSAPRRRKDL